MKLAVFAYSRQGCATARRAMACFPDSECRAYTMERFGEAGFATFARPSRPFYGELFAWADLMLFVGSCGIAVREIAPHVKDKKTDPAVICIDELGHFVISLLSGHIGGANEWTAFIAEKLGATSVITTATDINEKFSVDSWAVKNGCVIDSMRLAKAVSAAVLEHSVPLFSELPVSGALPAGLVFGDSGKLGVSISWSGKRPFEDTLLLVPKLLHLGVGCRKGIEADKVRFAVKSVLEDNNIDPRAIKCAASIDIKANEAGLLEYCREAGLEISFYPAETLASVPGEFSQSEFVKSVTGVDNVCERAALVGADKLIVRKTAIDGVTVAVAAEYSEVRFG